MAEETTKLLGNSPEFLRVLHAARMVAGTDTTVLISGQRGVGKELLAREIHTTSRRRSQPFRVVNCAGMSEGRFTPETGDQKGGTLFLDEIGELSQEMQARLLHLLEVDDPSAGALTDQRLLVSTSQDLHLLVEKGQFRQDLYYRLYVVPLEMPSLRERTDDLVLLLKHFNQDLARFHKRRAPRYSVTSRNLLKSYPWPGNVRELHNFCERMVILMAGKIIQPENLPLEIRRGAGQKSETSDFVLPAGGIDLLAMEGDIIRQALRMAGGNRSKAARLLGISRDTLLYRIQKHAIQV